MTKNKLDEMLRTHHKWLAGYGDGRRAKLIGDDLRRVDFSGTDLRRACLISTDLRGTNMRRADLSGADLRWANLTEADLSGTDLRETDLRSAVLGGADIRGARFYEPHVCPARGEFEAYKKLQGGVIATLRIPAQARRTSTLVGRKCRAEYAVVAALKGPGGLSIGEGASLYAAGTIYRIGETVLPDAYDPDIRVECASGIHFFMTRPEAEDYE